MNHQIPCLTSLRFIAAMCVFMCHLSIFLNLSNIPAALILSSFGMTIFFVLSGFVIHWNYHDKLKNENNYNQFNYIIARIARIYPLYILFLFLNIANTADISSFISYFPYYFTLTQSWFPISVFSNPTTFLGMSLMPIF